ncbi:MAG TPA: hypothetical protein VGM20_04820 [Gemmatimonadales bacterium]|jgi:hypothetical protein
MNRRIWIVLLVVVTLLAVTPHLPQWSTAISLALHHTNSADVATAWHTFVARTEDQVAANPWLIPAGAAVPVGLLFVILAVRAVRRRGAERVGRTDRAEAITEPAFELPVKELARPAASERPQSAPIEPAREPRRQRVGRRATVHRLNASGQSVAEIARVTRVGQDAVRFLVRAT